MAVAELKEQVVTLSEENRLLKEIQLGERKKPLQLKWGCYQFEGNEGLFCTACYDTKGQKIQVSRIPGGRFRQCPVCKAMLS
jgi:hypothetical protein